MIHAYVEFLSEKYYIIIFFDFSDRNRYYTIYRLEK